jgi:hypothetical protein
MAKRELGVSSTHSVFTYIYLHEAAKCLLEQAEATKEGGFYNCMCSNVFLAFCIEAYLNHICGELLPYWSDELKKDISTRNKLTIIRYHLNLTPNFSRRPFQSFNGIFKFRNLITHATSVNISYRGIQTIRDDELPKYPKTWWEERSNIATAKRWLADTESMVIKIHEAAGKGGAPFSVPSTHSYVGTLACRNLR